MLLRDILVKNTAKIIMIDTIITASRSESVPTSNPAPPSPSLEDCQQARITAIA